jgi:hypothetical protein
MLSHVNRYHEDTPLLASWEDLGQGAPTVIAFAQLCSRAISGGLSESSEALSEEALAILYAARDRGAIEIKGVNHAFESTERFLTVTVELDLERQLFFKRHNDPQLTVRFLDGFRQLCGRGLVMHHIYRDFSLSNTGFQRARQVDRNQIPILAQLLEEQSLGEC